MKSSFLHLFCFVILLAGSATAAEIPAGMVSQNRSFAVRNGSAFSTASIDQYEGKILILMMMTPWCPICQSQSRSVGTELMAHFSSASRGALQGKNNRGVEVVGLLLSTEPASNWDSTNASFASTNSFQQWGLDATPSRTNPRQTLGYFRGGFINSSNLYDWGEDRRRVVVINLVKNSPTRAYREILVNQNYFSSADGPAARDLINAIDSEQTMNAEITTQPVSQTINRDQTTTLSVTATGTAPLAFQWYEGSSGDTSTPVGGDQGTFTTPELQTTTAYWVQVSNHDGTSTDDSATATITVRQPAEITQQPAPANQIHAGESITLTVTATGDPPLAYQWYEGTGGSTTNPVGTNSASWTTPALYQSTAYWVRVTSASSSSAASSGTANITVQPPESVTIFTPAILPVGYVGSALSQTMKAGGGTAPYQWTLTAGALPDGLTLSADGLISGIATSAGSFSFTLQAEDDAGNTDSRAFSAVISDLAVLALPPPPAVKGVAYAHSLAATGGSPPYAWALVSGALPGGLALNAAGIVTGTAAAVGGSTVNVRVTDALGHQRERSFTVSVSSTFIAPVLQAVQLSPLTIGALFEHRLMAINHPKSFFVTGLPRGLKLTAATGLISGRPEVSGSFHLQIRATNSAGSSPVLSVPLVVRALTPYLVGTFGGMLSRDLSANRGLGGSLILTTTARGSFSIRAVSALPNSGAGAATAAYAAAGHMAATAPQITATLGTLPLAISINAVTGEMTGTLGAATLSGWRQFYHATAQPAEHLAGYYSLALGLADSADMGAAAVPQGSGYATFTLSLGGTLTLTGRTADGQTITCAAFLGPQGQFWLYGAANQKLGTIQGSLTLSEDPDGHFASNLIRGDVTWQKLKTTGLAYPLAFGPLNLRAEGGYLASTSKEPQILGLPEPGVVSLAFTHGGLAESATDPDLTLTYINDPRAMLTALGSNAGKVTATLNASTGAMGGSFTLVESSPVLLRNKVPFQGQVVRSADGSLKVIGYFMLPQIPIGGLPLSKSPVLSGGVELRQIP